MTTTPALKRTRRHLITILGLAALLLPVFLFVTSAALTQDRPVTPPPRGGRPRGPLAPVRTISIDSSYLLCNSLQLQAARRVVWEPVLASLGVSLRDRDVYGLALDNAATEVCAGRFDSALMNSAFGDLDRVMSGVEDRTFGRSLLTSDERIKLSSALMQAAYDEFQSRCFDNRGKEAELMIGRLPKTPDVGFDVEMQPASAALGRCGSGGSAARPGIDVDFAQSQFQSCAAKVLSNISQDCTGPAGQDRSPSTPRPTIENDSGWYAVPGVPGQQQRQFRANAPDGSYKNIYQNRTPDVTTTVTDAFDARGRPVTQTVEVQDREGRTIGRSVYYFATNTPAVGEPSNPRARRRYDAETRRINNTRASGADWAKYNEAVLNALGVPPSLIPAAPPDPSVAIPPGPAGPTNQCQAMTNSSTGRMGLLRPQSSEGVEGSGGREFISGPDLILRCLCALGSRGAQLANQIARATGSPGVSCSNNEWLRRVDCVLNPRGPADGIRPECLAYLRADYQFDTPQTACDAAIQCPEGSQPIVVGPPGSSACRCSKESSSSGPRINCALVRCPRPGTPSNDPSVQACCGAPGDKPDKPSDGPPIPPRPGESSSSQPGGGNEKPELFDPKKTEELVGTPVSVTLPKLLTPSELIGAARVTRGKIQIASIASAKSPEAKSLDWTGMSSGDQLTLRLDLKDQLSAGLYASFMLGPQGGSLRVLVNGKEIGEPIELGGVPESVTKALIGKIDFRPGSNTVTFVFRSGDKNSSTRVSLLELLLEK